MSCRARVIIGWRGGAACDEGGCSKREGALGAGPKERAVDLGGDGPDWGAVGPGDNGPGRKEAEPTRVVGGVACGEQGGMHAGHVT